VNIWRILFDASASLAAPSGRVPFTGAAVSATNLPQVIPARLHQAWCEMQYTLHKMERHGIVRARFTNTP
jgi:hypothetical protein